MPFDATQNPRRIAADVLRNTTKKQTMRKCRHGDAYCAIGVLISEIFNEEPMSADFQFFRRLEDNLGFPLSEIWSRNDRGDTFSEIADWLGSLPE